MILHFAIITKKTNVSAWLETWILDFPKNTEPPKIMYESSAVVGSLQINFEDKRILLKLCSTTKTTRKFTPKLKTFNV